MNDKMIKGIRVRVKDCWIRVKMRISSEFVININQCELLSKKYTYGFLKLNNVKRNKLEFVGPKGVSLYERLKKPLSEYEFFFILEQFVDVTQKLEKVGLPCSNLVLDLKYIFFNESTKELAFIYLPIATPHSGTDIMNFVEQIIYSVKPIENDSKYLSNFNYFIKKLDKFDADKIELYIRRIGSDIVSIIKKEDLNGGVWSKKAVRERSIKDLEDAMNDGRTDLMDNDEKTDILYEEDKQAGSLLYNGQISLHAESRRVMRAVDDESTYLLDDEVTELFSDDSRTELLDENQEGSSKFPRLIRTQTEEIIRINKPVFRIGTEENCVDYIVTNNIAISRSHADIISRSGRYFVFDLRSKNKSYVNNRVLPAEYEVEIFNGDILKFANEDFLFQI